MGLMSVGMVVGMMGMLTQPVLESTWGRDAEKANRQACAANLKALGQAVHKIGCIEAEQVPPRQVRKVELRGRLKRLPMDYWHLLDQRVAKQPPTEPSPHPSWGRWEIEVNGTTYELDLGNNLLVLDRVEQLEGKLVEVTGILETVWDLPRHRSGPCCMPFPRDVVRVETLKAADCEFIRITETVEVRATLQYHQVSFLQGYFVTVQGQTYRLDFSKNPDLWRIARQLEGKSVVVKGEVVVRRLCDISPLEALIPVHFIVVTDLHFDGIQLELALRK
jgi:hypothetical protein